MSILVSDGDVEDRVLMCFEGLPKGPFLSLQNISYDNSLLIDSFN